MRRVSRLSRVSGDLYAANATEHSQRQEQAILSELVATENTGLAGVNATQPESTALSLAMDEHGCTSAAEATLVGAVTLIFVLSTLMILGQSVRTATSRLAVWLNSAPSHLLTQQPGEDEAECSVCGRPDG
jgi:hypothetical protein